MRAIVCGGRRYCNSADRRVLVRSRLDAILPDAIIVGDDGRDYSHGVDTTAYYWAIEAAVDVACCRALWKKRGNSAGPRRNSFMLTLNADTLIHFPGGTGTADMIRQAKAAGLRIVNGLDLGGDDV
jgi:hypothetical protein